MPQLLRSSKGLEASRLIQVCPSCDKPNVHRRRRKGSEKYYCHYCKWTGSTPKMRERRKFRSDNARDTV